MRLRPRQRISRQADFAAVRKEGRRHHGAAFVFSVRTREAESVAPSVDPLPRFAVVASRRVGSAVVRNQVKRRMRAIFREHQNLFPAGCDVVASMRPKAARASFADMEKEFLAAAKRLGFSEPRVGETEPEPKGDREKT